MVATPGVRGVITFGSRLAHLENHEMDRIHRIAASGLEIEPLAGLKSGMRVKIIDGPLTGVQGVLGQLNGTARIFVNVELLNRTLSVQIESGAVAPANEACVAIPA